MELEQTEFFEMGEEQVMFRNMAREFAIRHIKPIEQDIDRDKKLPKDCINQMASLGLLGITLPQEYGGLGADHISQIVVAEEIARASISIAIPVFYSHSTVASTICDWGNDSRKHEYLPAMCKGEILACHTLGEPYGHYEATDIRADNMTEPDKWSLNGIKKFVLNGTASRLALVFANNIHNRGVLAFLADAEKCNFSTEEIPVKTALRGSNMAKLGFRDCFIDQQSVLGSTDQGSEIMATVRSNAWLNLSAAYVGLAQACIDAGIDYAQKREAFGKVISNYQAIQNLIADSYIKIQLARSFLYRVCDLKDKGRPFTREALLAKCYTSEMVEIIAENTFQIHGGYGYLHDFPVARFLRDAAGASIIGGSPLWQKVEIARHLLEAWH